MFNRKNKTFFIIIAIIIMFLVFLVSRYVKKPFSIDDISSYIQSFGKLGPIVFLAIFNLKTIFIVLPYTIFVLLGGTLFGSFYGILLSTLSVATTSTIAFFMARFLGKDKMSKLLKGRFPMLDEKTEDNGFNIILFMRLSCLFPVDGLSFAAGLTKIKYTHFVFASVLGLLPEVISISLLGHNIRNPLSKEFLFSVCLIVLTAGLSILVQKIIKVSKNQSIKQTKPTDL